MNMHNMERAGASWAKGLTLLAMLLALTACGITERAGKRVDDTWAGDMLFGDKEKVILTSDGGNQLNPDESGKPLSVVLRVYQLTALERFASTDPDSLWSDPQKALGNTLIDSQEITLLPGMGQNNQWPLNKATGYVGVAAFFRSEEKSQWKVAFDANSLRKDGIWFSSDGLRVLVDNNQVVAVRGADVLRQTPTQAQIAGTNTLPQAPGTPTVAQKVQDAVVQKAEDTAVDSAQKGMQSKFDSLLEGVHE
ncbi:MULTISPECIES: type VI secretion system lipoprotein TssJ [unclassified Pseudomonas]|uniref:type VI secretion system lipoprotein TssJ n=1 Tax=unclassified Pseudomonas TaxID=196821 RepID=UPI000D3AE3EF|nr:MULTISPECIES: type VI secretion system lipoprotein TssJ [unclassified Pseudomonas]RAU47853.1 type VI secretion system lipoprotein TssJ [Pseudomonas sp. RIT 409]RAU55453.1 type VI secretion system lipoprotein TssJ [Pseudomonas sp. RIT 412]